MSVGNIAPSSEIYDNNTWHDSNYGILAKHIMKKSNDYSKFEHVHTLIFNLAERITNHKIKFDEAFTQGVFNITKSFLKAQFEQNAPTAMPKTPGVIKKIQKVKTIKRTVEFDVSKITKKMMTDFSIYCGKLVKNNDLKRAGFHAHVEPLPELDILK